MIWKGPAKRLPYSYSFIHLTNLFGHNSTFWLSFIKFIIRSIQKLSPTLNALSMTLIKKYPFIQSIYVIVGYIHYRSTERRGDQSKLGISHLNSCSRRWDVLIGQFVRSVGCAWKLYRKLYIKETVLQGVRESCIASCIGSYIYIILQTVLQVGHESCIASCIRR